MKFVISAGILLLCLMALALVPVSIAQECGLGPVEGSCAACHKYWPCDPGRKSLTSYIHQRAR